MKITVKNILAAIMLVPAMALALTVAMPMQPAFAADTDSILDGANQAKSDDQAEDLFGEDGIFKTITNTALFLIGAVSVLMLIYGGIKYTLSGGVANDVTAAKNTILYAIVGIIVALLAYAIVNFVLESLIK